MFLQKGYLLLFLLLPPLFLFLWRRYHKGMDDFRLLIGPWRFSGLKDLYIFKWFFTSLLIVLYFVSIVLSLADIRFPDNPELEDVEGRDIIFCVDVSRSMNATDTGASRLELAAEAMAGVMEEEQSVRFGLVVFKGEATVYIPVTEDTYTLLDSLRYLGPGLLSSPGTNIQKGIDVSISAFPDSQDSRKQLILFTDGENLSGSLDGSDERLKQNRIEFTAVGVGTLNGSVIPLPGNNVVRDENGEPVISRLDEQSLRNLAEETAGSYRQLDQRGAVHGLVMEIASQKGVVYFKEKLGYRIFLIPAMIAVFFLYAIWGRSWKGVV